MFDNGGWKRSARAGLTSGALLFGVFNAHCDSDTFRQVAAGNLAGGLTTVFGGAIGAIDEGDRPVETGLTQIVAGLLEGYFAGIDVGETPDIYRPPGT